MTRPMTPHPAYPGPAVHHPQYLPRRRGVPTWAVLLVAAVLGLSVAGALLVSLAGQASAQVVREPVQTSGTNPFMPAVGTDASGLVAPAGTGGRFGADTAGLYGGTRDDGTCDAAKLTGFLRAHPDRAAAWAGALGLPVAQIDSYVAGLTPVVLRADTLVTNHGYAGGVATPFPAVLQAGSAVLVDRWGLPAVRCACGNPLAAAPTLYSGVVYTGPIWASFSETNVSVVVQSSVEIHDYTLVDPWRGTPFSRPAASHGDRDGEPAAGTVPGPATQAGVPGGSPSGGTVPGGTADGAPAPFDPASGTWSLPCGTATLTGGRGTAGDGSPAELVAVSSGDVDADGRGETAVLLECGTGDSARQSVQVVDEAGTVVGQLGDLVAPPGGTGTPRFDGTTFQLSGGTLTAGVEVTDATGTGAAGSATGQTWTWIWSGGTFVLDPSSVLPLTPPDTEPVSEPVTGPTTGDLPADAGVPATGTLPVPGYGDTGYGDTGYGDPGYGTGDVAAGTEAPTTAGTAPN